jgi:hypothetical protein
MVPMANRLSVCPHPLDPQHYQPSEAFNSIQLISTIIISSDSFCYSFRIIPPTPTVTAWQYKCDFGCIQNPKVYEKCTEHKLFSFHVFLHFFSQHFTGAFAEFRKANVIIGISVHRSVCSHATTRILVEKFSWNLIFEIIFANLSINYPG